MINSKTIIAVIFSIAIAFVIFWFWFIVPYFAQTNSSSPELPPVIQPEELSQPEPEPEPEEPISEAEFEILLREKLLEILEEEYKIFEQGENCGEVLAVHYNDLKMNVGEAIYLKWSLYAIDKAVVLKKTTAGYQPVFFLDTTSMRDVNGKVIIEQAEAQYGYGFNKTKKENNWIFDFAILDKGGKTNSALATFYWDTEKCGYAFFIAGEQVELGKDASAP